MKELSQLKKAKLDGFELPNGHIIIGMNDLDNRGWESLLKLHLTELLFTQKKKC